MKLVFIFVYLLFERILYEFQVDISPSMAYIMSAKDETEITTIKKAAHVTSVLFDKFFKQQVVKIVDEEKSVKHSKLADQIEQALDSKKYLGQGMDPDQFWKSFGFHFYWLTHSLL